MVIVGEWLVCEDGRTRPVVKVNLAAVDDRVCKETFLIDTGADQTVFSPRLLADLALPTSPPPAGTILQSASGASPYVVISTVLEFTRDDGAMARVRGEFAAFTDPASIEQSLLGRDVLDHFDLIVSRPRNDILLLSGQHRYEIAHS
jgi:hypothetical protein